MLAWITGFDHAPFGVGGDEDEFIDWFSIRLAMKQQKRLFELGTKLSRTRIGPISPMSGPLTTRRTRRKAAGRSYLT